MKTDFYTKAILTVIAISLVVLVFQNFSIVTPVHANSSATITELSSDVMDVNIVSINGIRLHSSKLEVEVVNTPTVELDTPRDGLRVSVSNTNDF